MIDRVKIERMRQGGRKLAAVREKVVAEIKPGVSLGFLDKVAEKLLTLGGGEPGFQRVPHYRWATCINVNDGVVHGIPHEHVIVKSGDIVTLDTGLYYQGFHTDAATTVAVGDVPGSVKRFLEVGKVALRQAIEAATVNHHIGHISQAMQAIVEGAGYSLARDLTGHGVGRTLHEPPMVPCRLLTDIESTPPLEPGMTLAIEVIYFEGDWHTVKAPDGWTIVSRDGKLAALFEETILVKKKGPEILTR